MRYLPHSQSDRTAMLKKIGVVDLDGLYRDAPANLVHKKPFNNLPNHQGELEVERHMVALSQKNLAANDAAFFCGAGVYRHHIPAAVDYLIQRGEFLTSYTPYQPEIAQGTLQYLFEFQTQVCLLTGMDVANASMYDGSTACAEAVTMANRVTKRSKAILSGGLHPHYRDIVTTNAEWTGFEAVALPPALTAENLQDKIDDQTSCVVVQYPDFFGNVNDYKKLADACHNKGVLLIVVVTEIISLGLLPPPGEFGADIVVAEGQSLGNAMNFGGPHVGLFACREQFIRQMPGRLCGETTDANGQRGFVLTLSTREQHIRREKATSNICTNAGLCALSFTIHLTLLGESGLKQLAALNHARAVQLAERLEKAGIEIVNKSFFNEFTVRLKKSAADVVEQLAKQNILAGVPASRLLPNNKDMENLLLVAVTETATDDDSDRLIAALERA